MKRLIPAVKGTRDFYPEQMAVRTWLYNTARSVSESFGFQEYEAPMLETLELYAARSGDELVREQAYVFADRGGDQIVLRPELTASLARMVAQRQAELVYPVRWWSFGPFWRYERPQKGRTREFFQWNVDILGADSPESDAENVAVLATFLQRVGLEPAQVMILVNDRRLMERAFEKLSIEAKLYPVVATWIDRRSKLSAEGWHTEGRKLGLSTGTLKELDRVVEDRELWKNSPELRRFFAAMEALGLAQYVQYDASTVRGLTYYTGTVFEAWEVGGEIRRALLGGGRYDNLLADVGGSRLPAVGFALGDVVMTLLLEKYHLLPRDLPVFPAAILVTVFDNDSVLRAYQLAAALREGGLSATVYAEPGKLARQFKYADRIKARLVIVEGPEERASGEVTVKNMRAGDQQRVSRQALVSACRRLLEPASPG
jgi:histidyl-tRNA synthetase